MKLLKPSIREHKRYLLLKGKFSKKEVEEAVLNYIGVLGYSKASPMWISDKIFAINREMINDVRGSFSLVENIDVENVSGTLKGLRGHSFRK